MVDVRAAAAHRARRFLDAALFLERPDAPRFETEPLQDQAAMSGAPSGSNASVSPSGARDGQRLLSAISCCLGKRTSKARRSTTRLTTSSCTIGALEGLVRKISGGVVPFGMRRTIVGDTAVACESVVFILTHLPLRASAQAVGDDPPKHDRW